MTGVRVLSPGPQGWGTTVTDTETGAGIKGISEIGIRIVPDDITRVEAHLFSTGLDVTGELSLYVADPATGESKEPTRIEFADGSVWTKV